MPPPPGYLCWQLCRESTAGAESGLLPSPDPNLGLLPLSDHQKLEREARICRLLKHPNIGKRVPPHSACPARR